MADKVQLIKEEIERQKSFCKKTFDVLHPDDLDAAIAYAHIELLDRLLQFINSLPEESTDKANYTPKSNDLEEEIDNYIKDNFFGSGSMGFFSNRTKQELNSIDVANIAHHFAEWQKDKMNLLLQTEYEKGLFDMQQAMIKDAVELHIVESFNPVGTENEKPHGFTALCYNAKYPDFYPVTGQTIKVIPIKEIQKNEQDCRTKGIGGISSTTRGN